MSQDDPVMQQTLNTISSEELKKTALEIRKNMGVKVLIFLTFITLMLLGVKRKIWKDIE